MNVVLNRYLRQLEQEAERAAALGDRVVRLEAAHSNYNFRHFAHHIVAQLKLDAVNAARRNG